MSEYDYVIVGGGVAGLYFAFRLLQKGERNFIILEGSDHVGGRNQVYKFHDTVVPLGAGAFRSTDKAVLALVKELKIPIYYFDQKFDFSLKDYDGDWYNKTIRRLHGERNVDVDTFLKSYFHHDKNLYNKFITHSFYTDFFKDNDSYYAIKYYPKTDLYHSSKKYFLTVPDIHEIIRVLSNRVFSHICLRKKVNMIEKKDKKWFVHTSQDTYITKNVVMATDFSGFKNIKFKPCLKSVKSILKYIGTNPFIRWYTFHDSVQVENPILTSGLGKKIFPIQEKVLMSGYADNEDAKKLKKFIQSSSLTQKTKVIQEMLENHGTVTKVKDSFYKYWNVATHYFRKGYSNNKDYFYEDNLYIVGEMPSFNQGWTEGALESVNHALADN